MAQPWYKRLTKGLSSSREQFQEQLNVVFDRGPEIDDEFWEALEETLVLSDMGVVASDEIVENLKLESQRKALENAFDVRDLLIDQIANQFAVPDDSEVKDVFEENPVCVLMVGINGTGKTTTCGKLAKLAVDEGRRVLLGSADTFRAAATEQLDIWAERANVEVVKRERGADPASVCFETIERGEEIGADFVLIDTAGRLHTSEDLMRELEKIHRVTKDRANIPVKTVLVVDATTGQNGISQARQFNEALGLDGLILTKLDGTAKGGIAVAITKELKLPIFRIGFGESIDDLRPFDAQDFARALVGDISGTFGEDEEGEYYIAYEEVPVDELPEDYQEGEALEPTEKAEKNEKKEEDDLFFEWDD